MTDDARTLFEAHASGYDDTLRRRLIPPYDAFYGSAVAALEPALAGRGENARVLDLGAGTGLLSAAVVAAWPQAELVLVDGAPAMLARARERLGEGARAFVVGDLRDPLPDGRPFDAVVSALAIHHLDDAGKRDLFARICAALRPGGVFVNAEQVRGTTPEEEAAWRAWHRDAAAALATTPAEWAAAERRMSADRCATVPDQLAWLRGAGFAAVDAAFHDRRFAVFAARVRD